MKKIIILSLSLLALSSCNDWLTVTPTGQVDADDLLRDENGYNSAVAGVYYMLSESTMFGCDLTWGAMDVMAQYWNVSNPGHSYAGLGNLNFTDAKAISSFNSYWQNYYVAIAQCNRILEGLEKNADDIAYSELFKAEALGLRAFCHMELFRMYGPVIRQESDLDKESIAYRSEFNVEALKFESGKSVLGKVKQDLLEALELTKDDPIKTYGRRGDANPSILNYNYIIANRGSHINYFGVLGLLARVEQLMLNQEGAYAYATRIIKESEETMINGTPIFKLVDNDELGKGDYNYSKEMLFAIYHENFYDLINFAFGMDNTSIDKKSGFPITPQLYVIFYSDIFTPEGGNDDNRLRYGFEEQSKGGNYDVIKLREGKKVDGVRAYEPEIPVMRLTEAYYIACEAQIGKDNALAISYLNKVRAARNLTALDVTSIDDASLLEILVRDMRKEFIGEGRMYMTYKRLFHRVIGKSETSFEPSDGIFVFPIPDSEYEYSPNVNPSDQPSE